MSRFFNPPTPWSELERKLSATTPESTVDIDPEATGSDAPAFSRPDRYSGPAHTEPVAWRGDETVPRVYEEPPGDNDAPTGNNSVGPNSTGTHTSTTGTALGTGSAAPALLRTAAPVVPYAELHAHSDFSFLDGASEPEKLIAEAAAKSLHAMALTDHNGLYGVVRFAQAATQARTPAGQRVKTVFGAELSVGLTEKVPGQVDPQAMHLLVLARSVEGYRQLSQAIATANLRGEKNRPVFDMEELAESNPDWYILTGCRKGPLGEVTSPLGQGHGGDGHAGGPAQALRRLTTLFPDRVVVELTRHGDPTDDERIGLLTDLARDFHLPAVATNAVHYATKDRFHDAQVRAAIRSRTPLDRLAGWLPPTADARIRTGTQMLARFGPDPVAHSVALADECAFELLAARAGLPAAPVPAGMSERDRLRALVTAGGTRTYGTRSRRPDAWEQIDRELTMIETMGFCGYFLIVEEIARFCADNGIYCQGRGSAANSAVCFVLGITAVDAVQFGLLFDRFLSPEREGYPDIDIDIESARREEVIQHVYDLYGRDRAAQVANVITYRAKSAVRDAAGALGFDPGQQDAFSKGLDRWSTLPQPADTNVPAQVLGLADDLLGTPRHLGIHSGGMILADRPISQVVPIEPAAMENRTVVQWDKDDCAAMDLVKFDLLGLGMLGALHEMIDLINRHTPAADLPGTNGRPFARTDIPPEDPAVYDMLCAADAVGVFQVESRAQLATLPRLAPREFYDLAVEVALIRPGPIQGGSVHPYIRRRQHPEEITYLHPSLEKSLGKTLGVPLFQEQLMQMAIDVAGFSGGDADELRRAMGSRRSAAKMEALARRFRAGCNARGIDDDTAQVIFEKIAAFANYGFPESHAISFANLVYESAWLKRHHHAAFTAGLLRSQPMGFYSPQSLVADARRHGVSIRPVDINSSQVLADLEPDPESLGGLAIRVGLESVRGVSLEAAEAVVAARADTPAGARPGGGAFTGLEDLAHRTGIGATALEALAGAGAFDCFGLDRRQALWLAGSLAGAGPDTLVGTSPVFHAPALPTMSDFEFTVAELMSTGLTVDSFPTQQLRPALAAQGYLSTADVHEVQDGTRVTVAGIVTHRQRPGTASGITFMNVEDEFGMLNVVCTAGFMKHYKQAALRRNTLVITGKIQKAGTVVSLYAHTLAPLEIELPTKSRNFQ